MNRFIIFLLFSGVTFCGNKGEESRIERDPRYKILEVKLADSLGQITLKIPSIYDTSFTWIHYSDCGKPCDEHKYRFQVKSLPIVKESGWMSNNSVIGPLNQLTISHSRHTPFFDGDTSKNIKRHSYLLSELVSEKLNPPVIFDTIQKIDGRYISIFAMKVSDSLEHQKVLAITTIRSNIIKFTFELIQKEKDSSSNDFIPESIKSVKEIRIENGM